MKKDKTEKMVKKGNKWFLAEEEEKTKKELEDELLLWQNKKIKRMEEAGIPCQNRIDRIQGLLDQMNN